MYMTLHGKRAYMYIRSMHKTIHIWLKTYDALQHVVFMHSICKDNLDRVPLKVSSIPLNLNLNYFFKDISVQPNDMCNSLSPIVCLCLLAH